jgi:hypothetical protein
MAVKHLNEPIERDARDAHTEARYQGLSNLEKFSESQKNWNRPNKIAPKRTHLGKWKEKG